MDLNRKIILSYRITLVSGVFCVIITLFLSLNYWNLEHNQSVEKDTIEEIVDRIKQESDSEELWKESLSLYFMAHKAYLTSCWQIKTGSYLLLICGIVLAISLKIYTGLRSRIDKPEEFTQEFIRERTSAQYWILLGGGVVLGLAFCSAFLSNTILKEYQNFVANIKPEHDHYDLNNIRKSTSESTSTTGDEIVIESERSDLNRLNSRIDKDTNEVILFVENEKLNNNTEQAFSGIEEFKRNHNSFRGFFGQGISYHQNIPVSWDCSSGQNVKWKVACSKPGFNSPVIWGDNLFISGADSQSRIVSCYNRFTGLLLWEREVKDITGSPTIPPKEYPETGLAAPTLTVDGQGVYAIFGTGDLIAFDMNGTRIWSRNLGVPKNPYNHSSSLMVWKEKLVIQYDTQLKGRMLTVNTRTGETIWDISRPVQTSWTSPILVRDNEKIQIITNADPFISGYDLNTGDELWSFNGMTGEVAASVAYDNGFVFANTAYASLFGIQPGPDVQQIWEDDEYLSEIPSPVAFRGLLYVPTNYGELVCYEAKTGKKYWEKWFDDELYSSPMIADGKVYILDKGGTMHILKADTTGTIINEPELGEEGYAVPAFADGMIYLRGTSNLYCISE